MPQSAHWVIGADDCSTAHWVKSQLSMSAIWYVLTPIQQITEAPPSFCGDDQRSRFRIAVPSLPQYAAESPCKNVDVGFWVG